MTEQSTTGRPDDDRREQVLDPAAGSSGHGAESIRDEQGTHEAGAVPAAFVGDDGGPAAGHGSRSADGSSGARPEDGEEPDAWDSEAHRG